MAALPLTGNYLHKAEMGYHVKFGHTIERMQHIALMSRIDICYRRVTKKNVKNCFKGGHFLPF